MKIQKIKYWLNEKNKEKQFSFIHEMWVERLRDGETFKIHEYLHVNLIDSPLCTIESFSDDRIHVRVYAIVSKKCFMTQINEIVSISPNLSYKKTRETF